MSTQITTAFVKQFSGNISMLAQQKVSRLRGAVRNEQINGEEAFFDQLGSVTATKRLTRHGDTPLTDTPHTRRQVKTATYEHADLIDDSDRVRLLIDPASDYSRVFSAAFGRAIDDEILDAATGTANTGRTGTGSETFDTTNYSIGSDSAGESGLTTTKLMQAKEKLDAAENDANEGYFAAVSSAEIRQLLTENVVENSGASSAAGLAFAPAAHGDYGSKFGLQTGELSSYAGFSIIRTERLNTGTNVNYVLCWAKNSLLLGVGMNPRARISERADKSYSTQVFMAMDVGATRMDATGVVRILCDASD